MHKTVRRRQSPVTAAYAFTDYRSQGQTLPYVIIDIASPPTGTLLRSVFQSVCRTFKEQWKGEYQTATRFRRQVLHGIAQSS